MAPEEKALLQAQLKDKLFADATTEKVARADLYFGEDMNTAVKAGRRPAFIYGDDLKTLEDAHKFMKASGYAGNMESIEFISKNGLSYAALVAEIARRTGAGEKPDNVGIRAVEGEFDFAGMKEDKIPGKLLEIQAIEMNGQKVYVAMNSYQTLLNMLLAAEGELPPGVSPDEKIRGIFRYLPRAIPIDYEKEVRSYMEAIEIIRTAA